VTSVAGTGVNGFSGDGGPAVAADIANPHGIVVAPDGTVYFSEDSNHVVRRIAPDGIITTVAGNGAVGFSGCREYRLRPPRAAPSVPAGCARTPS